MTSHQSSFYPLIAPHRRKIFSQLEGKNMGIVLPDADLDVAAAQACRARRVSCLVSCRGRSGAPSLVFGFVSCSLLPPQHAQWVGGGAACVQSW